MYYCLEKTEMISHVGKSHSTSYFQAKWYYLHFSYILARVYFKGLFLFPEEIFSEEVIILLYFIISLILHMLSYLNKSNATATTLFYFQFS